MLEGALAAALVATVWLATALRRQQRLLEASRARTRLDPLTGLADRRAMMWDLEGAVQDGDSHVVAVFDLDGVRRFNDAFGHAAGDALMAKLAHRLHAAVRRQGTAYRIGGDQFGVILRAAPGAEADDSVWRAATALREPVGDFLIDASVGAVAVPAEATAAGEALKLADRRLVRDKERRPSSAARQTREVLLAALAEREPNLHEHIKDVANMARAIAAELEIPHEDREVIAHAAELHDIGKVAMPDSILGKPGALDAKEIAFMRRHTVIGEDILRVAPVLHEVAALVRASHERWDGRGYPDGLAEEQIPLGSRIVAVCDAYSAMRQDRPYGEVMSHADAVAELRRCAGTQFDPAVVEAFCGAHSPRLVAVA